MAEKSKSTSNDVKKKGVCYDDSGDEGDSHVVSQLLMKLNLGPAHKKKLLVLSIGGLLCHRVFRKDRSSVLTSRSPDAISRSYKVYNRPYCTDFMKFCLERFEVGIWWNMNDVLDSIMVGLKSKLLFAWDQNQCTDSGFNTLENKHKPIFLKVLEDIWENKCSNLSVGMNQYSSSNTLLIDTDPYKALMNPPNTAVFPTEYKASDVNDTALGPLGELRLYLDGMAAADDVTSYVKEHPFGQPAITPNHPHWDYYSKIIRSNSKN